MTRSITHQPDPALDLVLERVVDVPRELVWKAWTTPEILKRWFTPAPWTTVACEIDLRPGGRFHTVMRSPEGKDHPGTGCFLEVVEHEKLVWTSALGPGYRPQASAERRRSRSRPSSRSKPTARAPGTPRSSFTPIRCRGRSMRTWASTRGGAPRSIS